MPYIKAHYHPFLFVLITMCAMAELGLTAYLISVGNESRNWPSTRYHSLLILFEFNAVWTTLFGAAYMLWIVDGAVHILASIASSIVWLAITSALWGAAAGTMHNTRTGGDCNWIPNSSGFVDGVSCDQLELSVSRCRETLTVEALGWVLFGLCVLTLLATCLWVRTSKRGYVSDSRRLV
ncbi:uncharacterized protein EDB91DRAFT_1046484 [Suillus paluster]|uniref:uncharacterized protein n=1 Tax=Suillus paluster TaxID=48578 RepID=UPI001B882D9D|nr:uncharacterized protein EDB91DRAFT_1046484 [Suillus paluster]KAG1750018.1 hypothetical protein EDB91DRAFT_1046484 [Suillus paluster]